MAALKDGYKKQIAGQGAGSNDYVLLAGGGHKGISDFATASVVAKGTNGLCPALPNETTTTKFLRLDGTWEVPTYTTDTDNTAIKLVSSISGNKKTDSTIIKAASSSALQIKGDTNKIIIGDGTNYIEVPITPSISNNVISNGTTTLGYLAKFSGSNTITNGPQLSSTAILTVSTSTKFLALDGSWQVPKYTSNTDNTSIKVGDTKVSDTSANGLVFTGGTNKFSISNGPTSVDIAITPSIGVVTNAVNGLVKAPNNSDLNVSSTKATSAYYVYGIATKNSTPTWYKLPDNAFANDTYSVFVKSGTGAASGLVPAPPTTAGTTKYLREDGTWATPVDTNTDTKVTQTLSVDSNTAVRPLIMGAAYGSATALTGANFVTTTDTVLASHLSYIKPSTGAIYAPAFYKTDGTEVSYSGHTHNYAGSASAGGPADYVKWESTSTDVSRRIPFAYGGTTETTNSKVRLVYNDSFKYNPSTDVLTVGSITGSAAKLGGRKLDELPLGYRELKTYNTTISGGNLDTAWKKLGTVTTGSGKYQATLMYGTIYYSSSNHAATAVLKFPFLITFDLLENEAVTNKVYMYVSSYVPDCIRVLRLAENSFEVLVRLPANYTYVTFEYLVWNFSCTVDFTNGSTLANATNTTTVIKDKTNLNGILLESKSDASYQADKLASAVSLWGNSFDGTTSVSGTLFSSSGIVASSNYTDSGMYWNDGSVNHPWYGIHQRLERNGIYSTTITNYFGLLLKTGGVEVALTEGGKVGIGTTEPESKLDINGSLSVGNSTSCDVYLRRPSLNYISASQEGGGIGFRVNGSTTTAAIIGSNGNVGIGTSTPDEKLHVVGAAKAQYYRFYGTDGSTGVGYVGRGSSSDNNVILGATDSIRFVAGSADRMRISAEGNVGIGTTSPSSRLHIYGNSYDDATITLQRNSTGDGGAGIHLCNNEGGGYITANATKLMFRNTATTTTAFYIDTSQNITASGTITGSSIYTNSDTRLKDNITPISDSIREFTWKKDGSKSYGFIAQELERTNPELVSSKEDGYKTVNYDAALCLTIAKLENRIKELEKMLKDK